MVNSKSLIHIDLTAVNNPQSGASASTVRKNHDIYKSSCFTCVLTLSQTKTRWPTVFLWSKGVKTRWSKVLFSDLVF